MVKVVRAKSLHAAVVGAATTLPDASLIFTTYGYLLRCRISWHRAQHVHANHVKESNAKLPLMLYLARSAPRLVHPCMQGTPIRYPQQAFVLWSCPILRFMMP